MGSGKTTLQMHLVEKGYRRVVTYTTRPRRDEETADVDYHFISEEEFLAKRESGFFAESFDYTGKFGHVYFGSSKADFESDDDTVIVMSPTGLRNIIKSGYDVIVVYLDVPEHLSRERASSRGDMPAEVDRRVSQENETFAEFEKEHLFTYRITETESDTPQDIVDKFSALF
jgi:guanylate kinase